MTVPTCCNQDNPVVSVGVKPVDMRPAGRKIADKPGHALAHLMKPWRVKRAVASSSEPLRVITTLGTLRMPVSGMAVAAGFQGREVRAS